MNKLHLFGFMAVGKTSPLNKVVDKAAAGQTAKPAKAPKPAKNAKYGKTANGKAAGLLKLMIKWAKVEKDEEAKAMLVTLIKKTKAEVWAKLDPKSQQELQNL